MVRIVRPIELALLLHIYPNASKSLRASYVEAYTTRLFVSHGQPWTPEVMKNSLKKWFGENLGLPNFGLHDFRHLAIALQAKFVKLDMPAINELEKMNNQLVGHSTQVAHSHYAREDYLGSCPKVEREMSLYLARQYHAVLGFATGSNEPDPPLLHKLRQTFNSNQATSESPASKAMISGVHVPNGLKEASNKKRARPKGTRPVEPEPAVPLRRTTRQVKKTPIYTADAGSEEDNDDDDDDDDDDDGMDEFQSEPIPDTDFASTSTGMMTRKRAREGKNVRGSRQQKAHAGKK